MLVRTEPSGTAGSETEGRARSRQQRWVGLELALHPQARPVTALPVEKAGVKRRQGQLTGGGELGRAALEQQRISDPKKRLAAKVTGSVPPKPSAVACSS